MGSTFYSLHYHVVFSTYERRRLIVPRWRNDLHAYMGGAIKGLDGIPETIGGVEDHVHLLLSLKTTHDVATVVRELKKASSSWAAENHDPAFKWQEGYSVFTVSYTHCGRVSNYINNQEEHHRKVQYVPELKQMLRKNGIEWEEKYLL